MGLGASIKKKILKSSGFKRFVSAVLGVVVAAAQFVPELQPYIPDLMEWGAILGGTALTHAAFSGTVTNYNTGSLAALVATLLGIASSVSGLAFLVPALIWINGILGVGAVTAKTIK